MNGAVMSNFTFADRYAQSALSPSAQIITSRQDSANRIIENATTSNVLDLAAAYYGSPDVNLSWFRDEFAKEDASFSLVNNEREMKVLAALILEQLIDREEPEAILGIVVGNVMGQRPPSDADWLLHSAKTALGRLSVANRKPEVVRTEVTSTINPKLKEEVTAIAEGDWAGLLAILAKMRAETQSSGSTVSTQATKGLSTLNREVELLREESQILWWLFSGHSKSLHRCFSMLNAPQAAVAGAIDLGLLTTASHFGPVAAPAFLERIVASAKKVKGSQSIEFSKVLDGFTSEDLGFLEISSVQLPPRLAPISAAVELAKNMGVGAWHTRYLSQTGLDASMAIDPMALANQLYREYLLGQLL